MTTGRIRSAAPWLVLAIVLVVGELVRLWGVRHQLPFVYSVDERWHFVKHAVKYFGPGYNPHYFQNPPGFSYLLHLVMALGYGGLWPSGVGPHLMAAFKRDPTDLFVLGRVTAGAIGVIAGGLLFVAARRMYGTVAGLVAATLLVLCFLSVNYSHLALNDVPVLAPVAVAMIGLALVGERGSWAGYLIAGAGLGIATGVKYTAAALVVPIVVAAAVRVHEDRSRLRGEAVRLIGAGAIALLAFAIINPYALAEPHAFLDNLQRQRHFSSGVHKLGLERQTGWRYYLWTLTWGYGWVPMGLSAIGAVLALRHEWRRAIVPLSFVAVFWLFMGSQERFYARYFLPVYPFLVLFAGYGVARLAGWARPRWRVALAVAVTAIALVQPFVTVVHNDRVLRRTDTRIQARAWLMAHLPRGSGLMLEPIGAPGFARATKDGVTSYLWQPYQPPKMRVENYDARLHPSLIDTYAREGYCVVVVGSVLRDRAFKDPKAAPRAIAYYRALDRRAERVIEFSPMKPGRTLPEFNFDMSFNYYDLGYERPGPLVSIYRLHNGYCKNRAIFKGEPGRRAQMPPQVTGSRPA